MHLVGTACWLKASTGATSGCLGIMGMSMRTVGCKRHDKGDRWLDGSRHDRCFSPEDIKSQDESHQATRTSLQSTPWPREGVRFTSRVPLPELSCSSISAGAYRIVPPTPVSFAAMKRYSIISYRKASTITERIKYYFMIVNCIVPPITA